MVVDGASHGSPGTDLVPLEGGRAVRGVLPALDVALGAGSAAVGAAARLGAIGRALAEVQRALETLVPAIVASIHVDAVVRRVDVDALLRRVDVEALLARVDL